MKPDEITIPPIEKVASQKGEGEIATEAVAVKNRDSIPKLVAKGRGEVARAIIQIAQRFDIPIYEDPDLLEALMVLDVGSKIPDKLYQLIAKIIEFVYDANKKFGYEPSS